MSGKFCRDRKLSIGKRFACVNRRGGIGKRVSSKERQATGRCSGFYFEVCIARPLRLAYVRLRGQEIIRRAEKDQNGGMPT